MAEALTESVERRWDSRLENWGLWYVEPGKPTGTTAYEVLDHQRTGGSSGGSEGAQTYEPDEPSSMIVDALDTDALVCRLTALLHAAIVAWYKRSGTLEMRAKTIGCHVNTLRNRREAAILELDRMDNPRTRKAGNGAAAVVVRRTQFVPDDIID